MAAIEPALSRSSFYNAIALPLLPQRNILRDMDLRERRVFAFRPAVKGFAEFGRHREETWGRQRLFVAPALVRRGRDPKYEGREDAVNRLISADCLAVRHAWVLGLRGPILSAVAGHVHGQLQTAPDTDFVECATQVVLDHLFAGADDFSDFAVGQTLPYQDRDLNFFRGEALAGGS